MLALSGAVPPVTPMWQRIGLVPADTTAGIFRLAGNRIYVSAPRSADRLDGWLTSAWQLDPLQQLWSTDASSGDDGTSLDVTDGGLVVQVGRQVEMMDLDTGRIRWTYRGEVQVLPGGRTLLAEESQFRPGTEYHQSSGDAGMLYYDADYGPHTEPPRRTRLRGLDVATGQERWSVALPGAIVAAPASSGAPAVVVVTSDRLLLLDADTGAVRQEQPLPDAPREIGYIEIFGDLVMLSEARATTAYDAASLDYRWQVPPASYTTNTNFCLGLPCRRLESTLAVLDPITGAVSWQTSGAVDLVARGRSTLAVEGYITAQRPLRTLSPATGAVQAELAGWGAVSDGPVDLPLILARSVTTDNRSYGTVFGALLPGSRTVREIGRSSVPVLGCRNDAVLIGCAGLTGIEVFRYRI